jgi:magnesium transporter
MLTLYYLRGQRLGAQVVHDFEDLSEEAVWIDLLAPTPEERTWVSQRYGQELPSQDAVEEIEVSSRFFVDDQGLHVRSFFLYEFPDRPRNITVAFLLNKGRLFTLRREKLETFHVFKAHAASSAGLVGDALDIMLRLFETKVDRLADVLESLHTASEVLGQRVFRVQERDLESLLLSIGSNDEVNDQLRLGLMDKQRVLSFLLRSGNFPQDKEPLLREILRDIESLNAHSTFLFEKGDSLMDATMGRINIEQNKIIKIFSIAAVVFLPPTLVASIYGMNFHFMPELQWAWGYPLAIALMVVSGIAPYLLFKRKGWL